MKNFSQVKRRCVLKVFLVSIILAIVVAKEKSHRDVLDSLDIGGINMDAIKERRAWRICHHGQCSGRRRSGKRGMHRVREAYF